MQQNHLRTIFDTNRYNIHKRYCPRPNENLHTELKSVCMKITKRKISILSNFLTTRQGNIPKRKEIAREGHKIGQNGVLSHPPLSAIAKKKQKSRPNPQTSNQNLKKNKKIKYKIITTNQNIHFQIITFLDRQPSYGARWGGVWGIVPPSLQNAPRRLKNAVL